MVYQVVAVNTVSGRPAATHHATYLAPVKVLASQLGRKVAKTVTAVVVVATTTMNEAQKLKQAGYFVLHVLSCFSRFMLAVLFYLRYTFFCRVIPTLLQLRETHHEQQRFFHWPRGQGPHLPRRRQDPGVLLHADPQRVRWQGQ